MLSAHPFTYPSHLSTYLPIYPPTPIRSSTHLIHPPIHTTPVHLSINLPVYHPSIRITRIHIWLFILLFPTICSYTHPSTYHPASTHLSIRPFNPSSHLPRHSSAYPSTHPHTRPSNHLSAHPLTHPPSIYPHHTPRPTHCLHIYPPYCPPTHCSARSQPTPPLFHLFAIRPSMYAVTSVSQ